MTMGDVESISRLSELFQFVDSIVDVGLALDCLLRRYQQQRLGCMTWHLRMAHELIV
jgi:hypothetical protein